MVFLCLIGTILAAQANNSPNIKSIKPAIKNHSITSSNNSNTLALNTQLGIRTKKKEGAYVIPAKSRSVAGNKKSRSFQLDAIAHNMPIE